MARLDEARERRRVRQEAEEQSRRERASAEREDMERRRGQQLKDGKKDGEAEAAHDEEARREQSIGQSFDSTR